MFPIKNHQWRAECFENISDARPAANLVFKNDSRAIAFALHWTKGSNRFVRLFYSGPDLMKYCVPLSSEWFAASYHNGINVAIGGIS